MEKLIFAAFFLKELHFLPFQFYPCNNEHNLGLLPLPLLTVAF